MAQNRLCDDALDVAVRDAPARQSSACPAGPMGSETIDDPSVSWPAVRRLETPGTISLSRLALEIETADRKPLFLPANLPDGIAAADPMLAVRNAISALLSASPVRGSVAPPQQIPSNLSRLLGLYRHSCSATLRPSQIAIRGPGAVHPRSLCYSG